MVLPASGRRRWPQHQVVPRLRAQPVQVADDRAVEYGGTLRAQFRLPPTGNRDFHPECERLDFPSPSFRRATATRILSDHRKSSNRRRQTSDRFSRLMQITTALERWTGFDRRRSSEMIMLTYPFHSSHVTVLVFVQIPTGDRHQICLIADPPGPAAGTIGGVPNPATREGEKTKETVMLEGLCEGVPGANTLFIKPGAILLRRVRRTGQHQWRYSTMNPKSPLRASRFDGAPARP